MRASHIVMLGAVAALAAPASAAEKFPSRPITLINPFTPGGPVDVHFRVLAPAMSKILGVPVLIENKPGATATLGPATMAATAKPDGYTISNFSTGIYSVPFIQKATFDPAKDFTYIVHLVGYRQRVIVRKDAPWHTWKEFVADAKARPGQISYASSGAGGVLHLIFESLSLSAGIKLLHVPFRGGAEALMAVVGGHTNTTASSGNAQALFDAGEIRALLSVTPKRNSRAPEVPSLEDEGITSDIDLSFPYGIGGPKGMDPAVVKVLHDAIRQASATPENQAIVKQLDLEDRYLNSADYHAFALTQIEGNRRMLDKLGMLRPM